MTRPLRSAAARAREATASLLAGQVSGIAPQVQTSAPQQSTSSRAAGREPKQPGAIVPPASSQSGPEQGGQRKRQRTVKVEEDANDTELIELPHNLGFVPAPRGAKAETKAESDKEVTLGSNGSIKREAESSGIDTLATDLQDTVNKATETLSPTTTTKPKKKQPKKTKANPYGLTPGVSPFPDWPHPTAQECEEVNLLLSGIHGEFNAPATIPEPSLTVPGCGEVPSVLDALVRTLLSGNTTGKNSAAAFAGLVKRFGVLESGIGKGSVDWDAVRRADVGDLFEAIKSGGLAKNKSRNIKAILDMVYRENQERRHILVKGDEAVDDANDSKETETLKIQQQQLEGKSEGAKLYEIACYDQSFLSLNHLHSLSTEEAMSHMIKYPGIGPKTAACVALFCLQRPCFAVDTHIFRICKWLNWVPPDKATEVSAYSHLEVRIPDHLKYSLHRLFIRHGKTCPRCRAITGLSSKGWEEGCVIEHLVKRTGKRKGGDGDDGGAGEIKKKRKGRNKVESESESEDEAMSPSLSPFMSMSSLSDAESS